MRRHGQVFGWRCSGYCSSPRLAACAQETPSPIADYVIGPGDMLNDLGLEGRGPDAPGASCCPTARSAFP